MGGAQHGRKREFHDGRYWQPRRGAAPSRWPDARETVATAAAAGMGTAAAVAEVAAGAVEVVAVERSIR
jgi:hypothetical protein